MRSAKRQKLNNGGAGHAASPSLGATEDNTASSSGNPANSQDGLPSTSFAVPVYQGGQYPDMGPLPDIDINALPKMPEPDYEAGAPNVYPYTHKGGLLNTSARLQKPAVGQYLLINGSLLTSKYLSSVYQNWSEA